ncbi:hypothetical protein ACN9MD_09530 [Stenotrophomonas maltophilia]|uniref:hypothetical protein n=1 Tax=Stenotrophomonas maltophilia TaxID=40324 RepID=UPI003CEC100A
MDVEQRALIQNLESNALAYELLGEKTLPRLLRAAAAVLTPPEGYVLVPVSPTEVMVNNGTTSCQWITPLECERVYKAMLAARPEVKP